ncbi:MAG: hypothetical protein HGB12_02495 [Bacteroidetes bacterium]|nr:hypothetical protein [Bacteroidota bacterium]
MKTKKTLPNAVNSALTMMATEKILTSLIIIFFFSILGIGIWLYEIVEIKTWHGLNWLRGELYSPFLIAILPVFAFMTPFFVNKQLTIKKSIISIVILYATNIICFQIGKQLCFHVYGYETWCFDWIKGEDVLKPLLPLIVLLIFIGLSYHITAHKFIEKNKKINVFFITILLPLIIPVSLISIELNSGFGSGTDWIDAVKMGYPIFWTAMLLGFAGLIVAEHAIE